MRLVAATLGVVLMAAGCIPEALITEGDCPPLADFKKVSPLLESRCGTLDCHGQTTRPLRLYGQYGLRLEDGSISGNLNQPTTEAEIAANHRSVCGLEPEKLSLVVAGEAEPESLTMVRKPRLAEKHKGGRIWDQGKPPDRCLVGWIRGDFEEGAMDPSDCKTATEE